MQPSPQDPRRRWVLASAGAMAGLLGAVSLIWAVSAPDEVEVCGWVLELVARAGEEAGEPERDACEAHYGERRDALGWWAWAKLARCTLRAETVSDAGGC